MKFASYLPDKFYSAGQSVATPSTRTASQFEVVSDLESFISLRPEWEELWRDAKGTPFQQFHYCLHAFCEVAKPMGASIHCIIGRKAGRIVFVWPLVRYRESVWNTVRPLAPDTSESADLLVATEEDPQALVSAAWRVLLSSCGSDVISLPMVRTDSPLYRLASRQRWVARGEPRLLRVAPMLRYPTWDQYRGALAAAFTKEQDYYQRRLQRAGKPEIFTADAADPLAAECVRKMLEWKRQWAERVGVGGNFFKEPYQNFVRKISADPALAHVIRVFVLALDGKPIAVNLVAVSERVVIGMQAAFDPAHAKLSPGLLLLEHVMKWALENRRDVELGPGDGKHKSNWADESGYTCVDFRIAVSHWGRTALAARALQGRLKALRHRLASGRFARIWSNRANKTRSGPPAQAGKKGN